MCYVMLLLLTLFYFYYPPHINLYCRCVLSFLPINEYDDDDDDVFKMLDTLGEYSSSKLLRRHSPSTIQEHGLTRAVYHAPAVVDSYQKLHWTPPQSQENHHNCPACHAVAPCAPLDSSSDVNSPGKTPISRAPSYRGSWRTREWYESLTVLRRTMRVNSSDGSCSEAAARCRSVRRPWIVRPERICRTLRWRCDLSTGDMSWYRPPASLGYPGPLLHGSYLLNTHQYSIV